MVLQDRREDLEGERAATAAHLQDIENQIESLGRQDFASVNVQAEETASDVRLEQVVLSVEQSGRAKLARGVRVGIVRNRPLRITQIPPWTWKRRGMTVFGTFGCLWLFLGPLFPLIKGTGLLPSLGVWGYFGLLFVALASTAAIELAVRRQAMTRLRLISFNVVLTETGTNWEVEAPEDLQTSVFTRLFIERLSRSATPQAALSHWYMYDHYLLLEVEGNTYREADGNLTLKENGVGDSVSTRILGRLKPEWYSRLMRPVFRMRTE